MPTCRHEGFRKESFLSSSISENVGDVGSNANYYLSIGLGRDNLGPMPRQPRLDTPGALQNLIGRGIERGAGRGLDAVGGACTESFLPGGGEEIGVYRGLGCAVFEGDDFVGQSVCQFRGRG